ncbi:uncharacterized protein [Temnothorax nylanderi]|uniref:uncharacterized protein isoform X1 n=1 Tax=Temnothorax nylanderi TaxID=102681 RepID=UPI003A84B5E7
MEHQNEKPRSRRKLQKLGKMKNGQNELKKFLKNRKYLCTKNNNNEDTDLSNLSSSEPNTSYSTHSTSDTDSEVDMSPITKEKLRQSRKIYSSPGSKQEDPDKNEVACTRQSSQLTGTPEELQPPEDRNETRGNQNRSLRASPNRPKSGCTRQSSQLAGTPEDLQPPEDRNETRGNQNQSSLRASPNRPKRTENVNGNTPKRTTSIRRKTLYRLKNRDEPSDSDEEYADVYNNRLQPETRESVDNEGRELYDIEGDEIYIGYGRTIQLAFWEYMRHRGHWKFLRELLEIFWTKENLVNRCFKKSRITTAIENRSPRKRFTPTKYKLLRRIFKDYLNEMYGNASKKKKILQNMNKHIGYKIRDLRKLNYEKVKNI